MYLLNLVLNVASVGTGKNASFVILNVTEIFFQACYTNLFSKKKSKFLVLDLTVPW